jgi:hypothetical protein
MISLHSLFNAIAKRTIQRNLVPSSRRKGEASHDPVTKNTPILRLFQKVNSQVFLTGLGLTKTFSGLWWTLSSLLIASDEISTVLKRLNMSAMEGMPIQNFRVVLATHSFNFELAPLIRLGRDQNPIKLVRVSKRRKSETLLVTSIAGFTCFENSLFFVKSKTVMRGSISSANLTKKDSLPGMLNRGRSVMMQTDPNELPLGTILETDDELRKIREQLMLQAPKATSPRPQSVEVWSDEQVFGTLMRAPSIYLTIYVDSITSPFVGCRSNHGLGRVASWGVGCCRGLRGPRFRQREWLL